MTPKTKTQKSTKGTKAAAAANTPSLYGIGIDKVSGILLANFGWLKIDVGTVKLDGKLVTCSSYQDVFVMNVDQIQGVHYEDKSLQPNPEAALGGMGGGNVDLSQLREMLQGGAGGAAGNPNFGGGFPGGGDEGLEDDGLGGDDPMAAAPQGDLDDDGGDDNDADDEFPHTDPAAPAPTTPSAA